MIIGIVITIYVGITKTTMASLFPSAPHFIQDINIGLVILIVNVIATVVVSIATKQKFSVIQGQAKAQ